MDDDPDDEASEGVRDAARIARASAVDAVRARLGEIRDLCELARASDERDPG